MSTHLGIEQSRRDDLECLGYVLLYFLKGTLPWQGVRAKTKKEKYDNIKDKKVETSLEELCQGLPEEFLLYMTECRKLKFEDRPDYSYLRKLFKDLFYRLGFEYDYIFDWMIQKKKNQQLIEIKPKATLELEVEDEEQQMMKDESLIKRVQNQMETVTS